MLSGNGRHRRRRQAPALVVAAGVTGSALAFPLLAATGASAAEATVDANTWDRLALCESGGLWSADMGNGYYGGLQFTQATWEEYGGLKHAPSADRASRAEQIAVAEKVLADQGPLAWPTCGLVAGFPDAENPTDEPAADDPSSDDPAADLPPATDPSDEKPSDGKPSEKPSGEKPDEGPSGEAPSDDKSDESGDKSHDGGTGETDNSGQNGGGRHRGEPAPEAPRGDGDDNSSGRHASRGDGSRGDAEGAYTVRLGDSLSAIADARDVDGGWAALYAANEKTVGLDPDLILPGQRLDLGAK
ncbi:transglycosylase family protein [Streptomyces boluensis]|uniref:LysM peptidoglycan-binding domain-containing protein n=1 Tax=Streptomyces boluensis TaxID=1775135 RepID=A0A964XMI5_9ACTN|nr:transglycosylase family protein [Streptomyces boluensis]NBE52628.1 LysM peptidoglycan-binding domain-containing protein [Streptomyces boluensis]